MTEKEILSQVALGTFTSRMLYDTLRDRTLDITTFKCLILALDNLYPSDGTFTPPANPFGRIPLLEMIHRITNHPRCTKNILDYVNVCHELRKIAMSEYHRPDQLVNSAIEHTPSTRWAAARDKNKLRATRDALRQKLFMMELFNDC